jgi:hypothetical protein
VSNAPESLAAFLAREFPSLSLHSVTYREGEWSSLWFELGGEIPNQVADERVAQAVARATSVFEAAFSPEDDGFLSFTRWLADDDRHLFSVVPSGCDPVRTEGEDFYEQDEPDTPHVTYTVALRPRSLNYQSLFDLIGSSELGRHPSVDGRAYLINASTPLIFHMHDDRGAILVASNEDALGELKTRFAGWIIP